MQYYTHDPPWFHYSEQWTTMVCSLRWDGVTLIYIFYKSDLQTQSFVVPNLASGVAFIRML